MLTGAARERHSQVPVLEDLNERPFIGESLGVRLVRERIQRLKDLAMPVAVVGPTGTGKEVVARFLHVSSRRAATGRFVAVNCAALPGGTAESQLFGHEAGSFTGATRTHHGFLEQAGNGTLFLDELPDMPINVQGMLLRVLEEGVFSRLGGQGQLRATFRLVVSSQKPLRSLTALGKLREDFFHRLNRVSIELSPLCERREDIPLLADHFNQVVAGEIGCPPQVLTRETLEALQQWHWPGNVRELRNDLERSYIVGLEEVLREKSIAGPGPRGRQRKSRVGRPPLDKTECRRKAREALELANGRYEIAARSLNISKSTLYRWLQGSLPEATRS